MRKRVRVWRAFGWRLTISYPAIPVPVPALLVGFSLGLIGRLAMT